MPIYAQIALDVAVRIARGELKEGSRITGRSTLAGEYKVSPETIRRAMFLLEETGILQIRQGSGITIASREKASAYAQKQKSSSTILDFKKNINRCIKEKAKLEKEIFSNVDMIIDYCERLRNLNPIYPMEFEIPDNSPLLGQHIKDLSFWQRTQGTVVGLRRNGEVIISPGPYAQLLKGDILLVVGDPACYDKVRQFLNTGEEIKESTEP
ncbi:MAG: TrkA C-terminal domain-containing protein [Eubacteriales bacterium]